jgi:hypothetical protein
MAKDDQYLGNDDEVIHLTDDQGTDPNAGWGSDDAVIVVEHPDDHKK